MVSYRNGLHSPSQNSFLAKTFCEIVYVFDQFSPGDHHKACLLIFGNTLETCLFSVKSSSERVVATRNSIARTYRQVLLITQ